MHGAFSHLFLQILIESGLSLELQMLLWLDMITQQNLAFLGSMKSEIMNFFDIMMYIIISDSTCYHIIFF